MCTNYSVASLDLRIYSASCNIYIYNNFYIKFYVMVDHESLAITRVLIEHKPCATGGRESMQ